MNLKGRRNCSLNNIFFKALNPSFVGDFLSDGSENEEFAVKLHTQNQFEINLYAEENFEVAVQAEETSPLAPPQGLCLVI